MVGISYFNHRKRKVSKISAGGRLRKNNQALSYLSKATREKNSFFLNGNQIVNTPEYTYLGTTFNSNGSFATSKKNLVQKSRRSVFACKRYIEFNKLSISKYNFLFDALFTPVVLYSSEVWGTYDSLNLKNG